jgi:tetratricopeptide (TPR) repeat protein
MPTPEEPLESLAEGTPVPPSSEGEPEAVSASPEPEAKAAAEAPTEAPAPQPAPPADEEVPATLVEPDPVSVLDSFLEGREALDWAKRAAQLTVELDQAEEKARIGELAYELGELYMRQLEDEASAVKAYGRALQADPSLRANLWAIRKIFYRRELWPNLVKLVGAELRFASNQEQRVDLLTERGRILLHHVKDLPAAQESYEQALALNPADIQSLLALERIARTGDNKALLWRALEGLARTVANPD